MSRLYDQLRNAARTRAAARTPTQPSALLAEALRRAEAARDPAIDLTPASLDAQERVAVAERARAAAEERAVFRARAHVDNETLALALATARLEAAQRAARAADERLLLAAQAERKREEAQQALRAAAALRREARRTQWKALRRRAKPVARAVFIVGAGVTVGTMLASLAPRLSDAVAAGHGARGPAVLKLDYRLDLTRRDAAAR